MKHKSLFRLSLVFAMTFVCAPMLAQAAPQGTPPPQAGRAPAHFDQDQRDAQRTIAGPYRLTYTLTEMNGAKRVGSQRYEIVLDAGREHPPAHLQLGTKIPIETAELQATSQPQTQISYIDIGMNIEASLLRVANGLDLTSHVSQSAVDSQQSFAKEPVIRRASLDSYVLLNENKLLTLGTVDMPGTTHILQIQVEVSKLP